MKFLTLLISVKTIIAFIGITLSTQAFSQETSSNKVSEKTDWAVFVEELPAKQCWATTKPSEPSKNTKNGIRVKVKRGDIQLYVMYQPSDDVKGQVSFTGGYPFAKDSSVTLSIDGKDFFLLTADEWAWAESDEQDALIIAAMKKGSKAVLTAKSSRGTRTQDTFSLLGFTAAVEDAEKRCK